MKTFLLTLCFALSLGSTSFAQLSIEDYLKDTILAISTQGIDLIYRNKFHDLDYGNSAEGPNYLNSTGSGLEYNCNSNDNNVNDFYFLNEPTAKVQFQQGDRFIPAGNVFSRDARWHIYYGNLGAYMTYFYNMNDASQIPDDITPRVYGNISCAPIITENQCLNHYGGTIEKEVLSESERLILESSFAQAQYNLNQVNSLYNSLIDGGSTDSKLNEITQATSSTMWELRTSLLGSSPHLSEAVLKAMTDRTDVFSDATIFEILSANPDELRNENLMTYLEEKQNPLPDYMITILKEVASGTSYRTVLESEITKYERIRNSTAQDILRSYLNEEECNYQQIRNWLDNIGGLHSDIQIINTYISEENFEAAFSLANMLPTLYNFNEEDMNSHQDFMYLLDLQYNLLNQNRTLSSLNEIELTNLTEISANNLGMPRAQAASILERFYGIVNDFCPEVNDNAMLQSSHISNLNYAKANGVELNFHPNPAGYWTSLDFKLPEAESTAEIIIMDISGNLIDRIIIQGNEGQKVIDFRNVASGSYTYKLTFGEIKLSGKIIISK